MNLVEEVMEYEVRSLERLLTLIEYKGNIFGPDLLESFERIIEKFNSSNTEIEIDKEMRKIQLLIFKIETENNSLSLTNVIIGTIKQFLNNYLVAYIILKGIKKENNLFLHSHNKMSNAINLVRHTELEFEPVKKFIKHIFFSDTEKE